jgi:hypothetical protein
LQRFQGTVLGLLDVGAYFVIIGCHLGGSLFCRSCLTCLTAVQHAPGVWYSRADGEDVAADVVVYLPAPRYEKC